MSKRTIELEYEMNTMPRVLYKYLSTPEGLAKWFAEDVTSDDEVTFSFLWHKDVSRAIVIEKVDGVSIRFRWEEDDDGDFFEFKIIKHELTRTCFLKVIDSSEDEEYDEVVRLWDFQIDGLKRILGA